MSKPGRYRETSGHAGLSGASPRVSLSGVSRCRTEPYDGLEIKTPETCVHSTVPRLNSSSASSFSPSNDSATILAILIGIREITEEFWVRKESWVRWPYISQATLGFSSRPDSDGQTFISTESRAYQVAPLAIAPASDALVPNAPVLPRKIRFELEIYSTVDTTEGGGASFFPGPYSFRATTLMRTDQFALVVV